MQNAEIALVGRNKVKQDAGTIYSEELQLLLVIFSLNVSCHSLEANLWFAPPAPPFLSQWKDRCNISQPSEPQLTHHYISALWYQFTSGLAALLRLGRQLPENEQEFTSFFIMMHMAGIWKLLDDIWITWASSEISVVLTYPIMQQRNLEERSCCFFSSQWGWTSPVFHIAAFFNQ